MRQATRLGIVLGLMLCAPAAAQLVDREEIFARAAGIASTNLTGVEIADLSLFRIGYELTLLETGHPGGVFEVDLLLRSSRSVLPAPEVIAGADGAEAAARLESLLTGVGFAYHYRTVRVRFPERGDTAHSATYSSLLLNRDPEPLGEGVSSPDTPDQPPPGRSTP